MRYNITYNGVDLLVVNNTLSILNRRVKEIKHYPGTDKADVYDLGREPTTIICELLATTKNQKISLEQLMNSSTTAELYINGEGRYYKKVTPEGEFEMSQQTENGKFWTAPATFVALDPYPYDIDSGQVLY